MAQVMAHNLREAREFAKRTGFPIKISSVYSLRRQWVVKDVRDFARLVKEGLSLSPTNEVLLEPCDRS